MVAILLIEDSPHLPNLLAKIIKGKIGNDLQKDFGMPTGEAFPRGIILEEAVRQILKEAVKEGNFGGVYDHIIKKIEKVLIGIILKEERGNQIKAANRLGLNRNTVRKKIKELAIISKVSMK